MSRVAIVAVLLGGLATARADDDVFRVVRDQKRTWTYDVVTGETIAGLQIVPDEPPTTCAAEPTLRLADMLLMELRCHTPLEPTDLRPGRQAVRSRWLAFEPDGVREVEVDLVQPKALRVKANAFAFTFPARLDRHWSSHRGDTSEGRHATILVHETTMHVAGADQRVWLSSVDTWDAGATRARRGAAAFLPGVGPALLCEDARDTKPTWVCLRLRAATGAAR